MTLDFPSPSRHERLTDRAEAIAHDRSYPWISRMLQQTRRCGTNPVRVLTCRTLSVTLINISSRDNVTRALLLPANPPLPRPRHQRSPEAQKFSSIVSGFILSPPIENEIVSADSEKSRRA